jgi:hypothetical protein
MKPSHIALLLSITLLAITSTALYTSLTELPANPTPTTPSTLTLVGVMGSRTFPVTVQGAEAATGYSPPYQDSDVLVMEHRECNISRTYYLYSPGFHREMMMAKSGGNGYVCGLTLDEINDAYTNDLRVEVEETPFQLTREGSEYDLLHVTAIKILDTHKAPLVVYHSINVTGMYHTIEYLGRVNLPQRFVAERNQFQYGTRIHSYQILLSVGDAIGFEFNSTQQVGFSIYAPGVQPSHVWYSENTTHLRSGLIALRRGVYNFVFTANLSIKANVTFNAWRMKWDPSEVLFRESGGSSGGMGGIFWESFYLEPLPKSFVVGRTWNGMYWTDRSISFEATLREGTEITYGYNATEPVIFSFRSGSGSVIGHDDLYSYQSTFRVPSTGSYTFSFDMAESRTVIVAFRCRAVNASSLSYPEDAAALISDSQNGEVKFNYPFPPAINRTTTITGKLGSSTLPDVSGKVMIIKSEDSMSKAFFLYLGTVSELIPVPVEGFTMLGNVSVSDLNNAYLGNSTVSVTGFPFQISRNGVVYDLFHVNSIEILGPYPLYARNSTVIVSGYNNQVLDGDKVEYFPIRFDLGFDYYPGNGETYYGNVERFYHSFLKQGTTIKISFNASKPVEFGLYSSNFNPDLPSVMTFNLGKPSDYLIRESGVQTFEQLFNVPRSGFYTFAFKAFSGVKASVIIDVSMIK